MNWYKQSSLHKKASVTFWPSGTDKISEPLILLDICHEITQYGWYVGKIFRQGQAMSMDMVEPSQDSSFDAPTGIIDIFVPTKRHITDPISGKYAWEDIPVDERFSEEQAQLLINGFNEHKAGSVVLGPPQEELSPGGTIVYKTEVLENNTVDLERIPEINLANDNAKSLLEILQKHGLDVMPSEYAGSFNVDDYLGARQLMIDDTLKQYERPESQEGNMIGFGLNLNRIQAYLDGLDQIANWIKSNNLPKQEISFG